MPLKLNTASGGGVTLQGANTATDVTVTVPATSGGTAIVADSSGNVQISGNLSATGVIDGTSMTLLGTLTTTSGTTHTLSSLNLTTYSLLILSFNNVSFSSTTNATLLLGGVALANALTQAADGFTGVCTLDLSLGVGFSGVASLPTGNGSSNGNARSIRTSITTASTSVTVSSGGATFDAGSVRIYGVK